MAIRPRLAAGRDVDMTGTEQQMSKNSPSNEQWVIVQRLFEEMLDSADPSKFIAKQSDAVIREALAKLWAQHQQAEREGFLEQQITLVKELTASQPPGFTFQTGQVLAGRFAILRLLGTGGMGEVYLADDRRLQETVALKTLRAELEAFPENRERFLDEVRRARQVTHPNVCRIFDIFQHEGLSFYSMEYVAGATLAEVLKSGQIKAERARQIADQAAAGLGAAHGNGVLHCDFKPANVILTGSGKSERAVVTDFGLALAVSPARRTHLQDHRRNAGLHGARSQGSATALGKKRHLRVWKSAE